ncbi:hypothetical protein OROGR_022613 [Orobanche gracilis]
MAPPLLLVVALAFAISAQCTLGSIECENLNEDSCAYAVSSTGRRCLLEKHAIEGGYTCGASEIVADKLKDWIETEDCISACGVDRKALGISPNSLLDNRFAGKLCSVGCYRGCPNIVDLYFNLAAGEGVFLPKFCEALGSNGRPEVTNDKVLYPFEVAAGIGSNEGALVSDVRLPAATHQQDVSLRRLLRKSSSPSKGHNAVPRHKKKAPAAAPTQQ